MRCVETHLPFPLLLPRLDGDEQFFMVRSRELCSEANSESSSSSSSSSSSDDERDKCSALSSFPFLGRDNAERLLLREGVIDSIPKKCGNNGSKNVILAIGDGMGWEMVSAKRGLWIYWLIKITAHHDSS